MSTFKVFAYWPEGQVFERLINFSDRTAADRYVRTEDKREEKMARLYGMSRVRFEVREVRA